MYPFPALVLTPPVLHYKYTYLPCDVISICPFVPVSGGSRHLILGQLSLRDLSLPGAKQEANISIRFWALQEEWPFTNPPSRISPAPGSAATGLQVRGNRNL